MDFGKKRVGNFTVLKYKKEDMPCIKVSTLAKDWAVEFSFTHVFFALIDSMDIEEDCNVLKAMFVAWYASSSISDPAFIRSLYEHIDSYMNKKMENSEEKDGENLDVVKEVYELTEDYESLEKEVGNGLQQAAES